MSSLSYILAAASTPLRPPIAGPQKVESLANPYQKISNVEFPVGDRPLVPPLITAPHIIRHRRTSPCELILLILVKRLRQLIGVLHLSIRRIEIQHTVLMPRIIIVVVVVVTECPSFTRKRPIVRGNRDAALAPRGATATAVPVTAPATERRRALLVVAASGRVAIDVLAKDAPQQPALAHVVGVDDAAGAQLDALPRVVDPGEVDVERGLQEPEDDLHGLGLGVVDVELAVDPVEDVQAAVEAEREEVVGVDDGGDGGLAEEEELREDADGFENIGEVPEPLFGGGGKLVGCSGVVRTHREQQLT